ncbi:murein L,D-transpeptidase [Phenylobacterium sp.]|uniref:L,D-transpeptidase family protein n=1 Tax=Phenylobacterium sp. TaxID=1871053 RepID=UPI00272F28AB|nr:L,D-transpeptidase family protein [Phenylobacterium sp.]MDP1872583.1 L,D-transpeptidase family protein [Phenylobacterium sp.]
MIWLLRLGALALALLSTPAVAAEPLTRMERSAIIKALEAGPEPAQAATGVVTSEALEAQLMAHARREAGLVAQPARLNRLWALEPAPRDLSAEWTSARTSGAAEAWIRSLSPADPRYRRLVAARRDYAARVAAGNWTTLETGQILRLGDDDPAVVALRTRLAAEGFETPTPEAPSLYDEALEAAVRTYQELRGLAADAVVGPATYRALNVSAAVRLAQIDANLERWRWLPRPLPAVRIEADAGSARATLFVDAAPVLEMRIIVGAPSTKTPMFASEVETVVFNPPWNVPTSIARGEILPRAARDPGYLARNNFTYQNGRLQQRPGPSNSLGQVKFDMASPFGVYLHDTPGRAAFLRPVRTLSHGCMRLEKPRELATLLLASQGWTRETVDGAIAQGQTRRVDLAAPVPVFVVYSTAFVNEEGLHLLADPYGWDAQLTAALQGQVLAQLDRDMAPPESECASSAG